MCNQIIDIKNRVVAQERISEEEAILLYNKMPLFELMQLAVDIKKRKSGDCIYFNRNFHLEPTNICRFRCKFCSYRKVESDSNSWDMTLEDVAKSVEKYYEDGVTEVHLVGGVGPKHNFEHYKKIISLVNSLVPSNVSLKAFSAVEHIEIMKQASISFEDGLKELIACGLDSITGGGAEVFDEDIRREICPDKATSSEWLEFHKTAHKLGVKTSATMLYGHIEKIEHRVNHLSRLRDLQDQTNGFISFIPLKFRAKNNPMSHVGECSVIEDLRTLAISRIFLDNFPHIKAYWPMYGKSTTQFALMAGADDVDGTLKDSTKIYSMAGVDENSLSENDLKKMIIEVGFIPIERDTFYNRVEK